MACDMTKILNFSKPKQELIAICVDHYSGDLVNFVAENVKTDNKSIDDQIRKRFESEILGGAAFNHRTYRKYKNDIFEIIEVVLDQSIPEGWKENEFFNKFVEERRLDIGEMNEFYANQNTLLTVSRFSGNHWDTNRERFDIGKPFSVPTSWYEIHFYNEFERFMKGIDSFVSLMDKARKSFLQAFQNSVYAAFASMSEYAPSEFSGNGALTSDADKEALMAVVEKVEAYNGVKPILVGVTSALRKLQNKIDVDWAPESSKEERRRTGVVQYWEGYELLPLPQVFKQGTFDFMLPNNEIQIVASNSKPIKFVYEGDSRMKEVTDNRENMDQTLEAQIQIKAGVGVAMEGLSGKWTLA